MPPFGRLLGALPWVRILLLAQGAVAVKRHVEKLDPPERRELLAILKTAKGRPDKLTPAQRARLGELVAKLEPGLLAREVAGLRRR